jgi:hypothetical protein
MIMLVNRITRAFTFQREVYAEVEHDTTFTSTAWILVIAITFLNQVGSNASSDLVNWVSRTALGTVSGVIAFAIAAVVMNWMGRTLFNAEVTFDEVVRTLGLAYVWNIVAFVGALASVSTVLSCLLAPGLVIGWIMLILSWFVAMREALDLDVGQTIITVVLGWIAFGFIMAAGSIAMNIIGWTATGFWELLGF